MNVFITGISGFVGRHLATALVASGHRVVGVGGRRTPGGLDGENIRYIPADTTRPGPWQEEAAQADIIVNLAGRTIARRWTRSYKKELYDSRIETTRHLAAALRPDGGQVLLSTSATGFYGDGGEGVLTEKSPVGTGFLAELSHDWEQAARTAEDRSARVCCMRFGVVLGADGGALVEMLRAFRRGLGGPLGSGRQWFSWIHIQDLVEAILFLMTADLTGPVNLVAPEPVRQMDLARALGRHLGKPAFIPAPSPLLRLALGEMASALLASQRVVPHRLTAASFNFRYPDIDSALTALLEGVH
jgi:hypothetical protein